MKLSLEIQGLDNVKAKEARLSKEEMKGQVQDSVCCTSAATGNHRRTSRGISITLKLQLFLEGVTHTTNSVEKPRLKSICQQIGRLYFRTCKGYKPF